MDWGNKGGELTRSGVHGGYTGQEISRQGVATGGGSCVGAVGGDHVVDCGHVDGVLFEERGR